jgi:hypothetical protein
MFEMYKYTLNKMSFDELLLRKELLKAIEHINSSEKHLLKNWCLSTFPKHHSKIIYEVFNKNQTENETINSFI